MCHFIDAAPSIVIEQNKYNTTQGRCTFSVRISNLHKMDILMQGRVLLIQHITLQGRIQDFKLRGGGRI